MRNLSLVFFILLLSCGQKHLRVDTSAPALADTAKGSCPYLTKDNKGNIVLSWIKEVSDSTYIFCYAVSADKGKSFGKPVLIPASASVHPHAENIPKVIFKPSGEIIAVWGAPNPNPANAWSGLVYYSQSFDDGKSWTPATRLVHDSSGYDQRYFDVALKPDGEAAIIWLDNRKRWTKDGSALFLATTKNRRGFAEEKIIAGPCCECCRTVLSATSNNRLHVLYRAIIHDSIRDMVHMYSDNGGETFSAAEKISNDNWVINGCPHAGPSMTATPGALHFAWFTGSKPAGIYYTSRQGSENTFAPRETVSERGRHPQIASCLSGSGVVMVWDESFKMQDTLLSKISARIKFDGQLVNLAVTPLHSINKYPVVCDAGNNTIVIAYSTFVGDDTRAAFQQLRLKQ